jgi:hypothetical protein
MSKKIVFSRFGMGPDPRVSEVLMSEIIKNKNEAKILPLPGIIISVFESELTPTQIRDRFKNDSELSEVPFMVTTLEDFDINLPEKIRKSVFGIGETSSPSSSASHLTMDDLLELISVKGLSGLTPQEKSRLDELRSEF